MRFWLGVLLEIVIVGGGVAIGVVFAAVPRQCRPAFEATVDSAAAASVVHPCNFDTQHLCVTVR